MSRSRKKKAKRDEETPRSWPPRNRMVRRANHRDLKHYDRNGEIVE